MSYTLTGTASIQAISSTQDFQTLLKHTITGLTVDFSTIVTVSLTATVERTISLPLTKIQLIVVKATQPVDLSLKATLGNPTYTLFPSMFHMVINPTGLAFDHIKLLSTVGATAEVAVAGLFQ